MKFLRPPAPIAQITDPARVSSSYQYWRIRIFAAIFFGYIFFYFTRKSFAFAMPALSQDLGFDKAQLGFLLSVSAITYGVSKFISGIQGDRSNARYFMAIGLVLTGIFNILFGYSSSIFWFAVFWGLNGWFQGWGWPACARTLTHWYGKKERGRWWAVWSTSHNIGGAAIAIIAAYCVQYNGWRFAMWAPGIFCILMGLFVIYRLRDTPQSLGLPPIEVFQGEETAEEAKNERELLVSEILWTYVIQNPAIWALAGANFFVYIIRTAVSDWTMFYLTETAAFTDIQSSSVVSWFEFGGLAGMLLAGWASDKYFQSNRGLISLLLMLCSLLPIGLFWFSPHGYLAIDSALTFSIGFFLFGPQMLIGCAAAEASHKKAAATASGFAGCFAYLGAAVSGYPLGSLVGSYGWDAYFVIMIAAAVLAAVCFVPVWLKDSRPAAIQAEV